MSSTPLPAPPVLHIWPAEGDTPSLDPSCLAAFLYFQCYFPGRFVLSYCSNPDDSPSGQLPFLTHGQNKITGLSAIFKFVAQLGPILSPDSSLDVTEKAQCVARIAHVESVLGDITAYAYYVLSANWYGRTYPVLTSSLPLPQRLYVPGRLRSSHRPRLEASGLWHDDTEIQEEGRFSSFEKLIRKKDAEIKRAKLDSAFERDKVLSKARVFLDAYSAFLNNKSSFYGSPDRPSTLDVIFAAHILLLNQPLPDPSFAKLLQDYPGLVTQASRVRSLALAGPAPSLSYAASSGLGVTIRSLLPRPVYSKGVKERHPLDDRRKKEEAEYTKYRLAFYGAVTVVSASYVYFVGLVPALLQAFERQRLELEAAEGGLEDEEDEREGEEEDE